MGDLPALTEQLLQQGPLFSFVQAVRLLAREELLASEDPAHGLRLRVEWSAPADAPEVVRIEPATAQTGPTLVVAPTVLLGVLEKQPWSDLADVAPTELHTWLDLFVQRWLPLMYRSLTQQRWPFEAEPPSLADRCTQTVLTLSGLAAQPDETLLDVTARLTSGLALSQRPCSAVALETFLAERLQVPVRVRQFQGQWLRLTPEQQTQLGTFGRNNQLGVTAVLGERVWDQVGHFTLELGPLSYAEFVTFWPEAPSSVTARWPTLVQWTRRLVGPELTFTVRLGLRPEDVPECCLEDYDEALTPRLGWNTWLRSQEPEQVVSDTAFGVLG